MFDVRDSVVNASAEDSEDIAEEGDGVLRGIGGGCFVVQFSSEKE